jgi:hypothetical protein
VCLPAILGATEVALTGSATATATLTTGSTGTAPTTFAIHWSRFIDHQSAAMEIPAITVLNCLLCGCFVVDFDKGKASGLTAETVAHHVYIVY